MPPKKNPITDPTGEKATAKAARSADKKARERLKSRFSGESASQLKDTAQKIAENTSSVGDTAKTVTTAVSTVSNSLGNVAESVGLIPTGKTSQTIKTHDAYGGLSLPVFEPQQFIAGDLFADSSTLPRTSKLEADAIVESIEEKRQTLRVVGANLDLNTDVLKTGVKSEKMTQAAIDYGTSRVNTDTKLTQFETAQVQYEIGLTKLDQTREKLSHEQVTLEGLRNETDQRKRFWYEKYNLGESRIKQVQLAKYQLDAKIGAIEVEGEVAE
ncbi:hypothetical protein [aff. Roholtiella sp. LEGE 12411]|uniref:hypothetical protein n=1 Tax=aff. Roholtiella sp. LEGE 12411 TaxID=1828822 RepID=UPI00188023DB|nr:hypothetical protein [aff. Roholtiella sp. LEGE 12411]MBE9038123.1 hypothetical protein [aff. Roholtiella sp. LEGE 12411]